MRNCAKILSTVGRYGHTVWRRTFVCAACPVLLFVLSGCVESTGTTTPIERLPLSAEHRLDSLFSDYPKLVLEGVRPDTAGAARWVDSTLSSMTLGEKIGQLLIVDFDGNGSELVGKLRHAIEQGGVGGVLVPRIMSPGDLREAVVAMQELAAVPLLVAADFERGAGRFSNNLTELPSNMAIGATRDTVLAAAAGRLTAIEGRALGVNMLLAPVADVNRDPANPIINIRAFGDRPRSVASYASSFSHEAERWGALTTFKHFPGHGNTSIDSHTSLAVVPGSTADIRQNDVFPFEYAVRTNRPPAAVMTAHVWVPAYDPEPLASTISSKIVTDLLRKQTRYEGIIVTDDVRMGALASEYNLAQRTVLPLVAGSDMILTPDDVDDARVAIRRAVANGTIHEADISRSVRRILSAKAAAGLHNSRLVPVDILAELMGHPYGQAIANQIGKASITVSGSQRPIVDTRNLSVLHLANFVGSESINAAMDSVDTWLGTEQSVRSSLDLSDPERLKVFKSLETADPLVIVLYSRLRSGRGEAGLYRGHRELVRSLLARRPEAVILSLGNPYDVDDLRAGHVAVIGYDQTIATARAAVHVLLGRADARGVAPVSGVGQ